MTNVLEERYRSLLRILPADYRAKWEEEMVATYLQGVATDDEETAEYLAEFGRPGWSEVASVVGLAVRLRMPIVRRHLGGTDSAPRHRAFGDAVRIVALLGLLAQAALALTGLAMQLWLAGRVPGLAPPTAAWVADRTGPWPTVLVLLQFAAVPAYLLLVTGRWPAARLLALIATGAVLVAAVSDVVGGDPVQLTRVVALLVDGLLLAALWAFHRTAPPINRRAWLIGLPVALVVTTGIVAVTAVVGPVLWFVDWPAMCCVVVAAGLAVHLVRPGRGAAWPLAMAGLAGIMLVQRLLTLAEFASHTTANQVTAVVVAGTVEAGVVAVLGLAAALRARRALRRLPSVGAAVADALAQNG